MGLLVLLLIPLLATPLYLGYYFQNKIFTKQNIFFLLRVIFLALGFLFIMLPNKLAQEFNSIYGSDYLAFITPMFPDTGVNFLLYLQQALGFSLFPIILLSLHFKESKPLQLLMLFYVPLIAIINLVFIQTHTFAFTGIKSLKDALTQMGFFIPLFYYLWALVISSFFIVEQIKLKLPRDYASYIYSVWLLLIILILTIPNMGVGLMLAWSSKKYIDFKGAHLVIVFAALFMPFIISILMRKQSLQNKAIMLYLLTYSAFVFVFYYYDFNSIMRLDNLPLHLCHTAILFLMIAIPYQNKSIFYFTYFVNILGAFFALVFPSINGSSGIFSPWVVHFYFEHIYIFIIPIIAVGINYFPRPQLKNTFYSLAFFSIYFLLIMGANTFFPVINSSLFGTTGRNVDYFFLNGEELTKHIILFKVAKRKYLYTINIGGEVAKVYYLYWLLLYFGFVFLTLVMLSIYQYFYNLKAIYHNLFIKYRWHFKKQLAPKLLKEVKEMLPRINASLEINHFYKKYPQAKNYSVKDFSLSVKGGEIFGFIGHNGAGKSTLIKALVGEHSASLGRIKICGYDTQIEPAQAKFLVGYVPDNHPLYERLTAYEYIKYIAAIYMVDNKHLQLRLDYYAKLFAITPFLHQQIATFSHGMKQKIAVIASLIHEPKVWILDEPLTGLDPTSVLMIRECIVNHAKKGNIVFFSSHIIEVVENICNRIAVIKKGELRLDCSVNDAIHEYGNLTNVYRRYVLDEE